MRVSETTPKKGDYYPTVRAWMARLGATDLDILANETQMKDRAAIQVYVKAILGEKFDLRFRVLHGAEGRGGSSHIVLDRRKVDAGTMSLGTVLYECAHAIQHTRLKERRSEHRRTKLTERMLSNGRKLVVTKPNWTRFEERGERGHGEPFCRTYARLLRSVLT